MDPEIRWTDRIYSQQPEWSGNVFDFFNRVSQKLLLDLKKPFKLVNQVRVDETPQHDAVREALVNCLVNTDFYQSWSVVIEKYPDKIVMANPGTIIAGKKQMLKGGVSQPRNKGLFKMFNLIGLGEHAGSGVPDIYKAWRDAGLNEPIVEESFGGGTPDRTILTLPLIGVIKVSDDLKMSDKFVSIDISSEKIEKLLSFCGIPKSKNEMMKFLDISSRSTFERKILNPLLENGQLFRTEPENPKSPKQKYFSRK